MRKKISIAVGLLLLAAVGGYGYWYFWVVAATPALFDKSTTLEQAQARAVEHDRIVLAVVTADFCPTCQAYKRSGLADTEVLEWARRNAETVYLEWERHPEVIDSLEVRGFPATLTLTADGSLLESHYGPMSGDELLALLERSRVNQRDTQQ